MSALRRGPISAALAAILLATAAPSALAQGCADPARGLGVSRVVMIDASDGPVFGSITKQEREKSFLKPKEVVLTFDDGPMPGVTKPILDILDRFCTKATFFSVGKMAIAYPELVREVMRRGHTMGTHTWSHPMNLPRLRAEQARDQIESGFAAVTLAAGEPIAPFFRFPGLNDSKALVGHLEGRNIATFTVDVVSNDSYITDVPRLIDRTMSEAQSENGGIMLFHDIKPQTVRALPEIMSQLQAKGFKVVHLKSKHPFKVDDRYTAAVGEHVAAKNPAAAKMLLAITERQPAPAPLQPAAEEAQTVAAIPQAEPQATISAAASGPMPSRSTPKIINAAGINPTNTGDATTAPSQTTPVAPAISGIASETATAAAELPHPAMTPETRAAARRMPRPVATPPKEDVAATVASQAVPPAAPTAPAAAAQDTPKKPAAVIVINAPDAVKVAAKDAAKQATAQPRPVAAPVSPNRATTSRAAPVSPPAAIAAAAPATTPSATQPAKPAAPAGFEVLAGSYDAKPSAAPGAPSPQPSQPAVPEVLAGSYGNKPSKAQPPLPAKRGEKAWDDGWQENIRSKSN